jgi:3-hydroxyisobutyrate dehydrogenase
MPVGFIGLGNLGSAIAQRLCDCNVDLIVFNRSAGKAEGIKARRATNLNELMRECETVFMCLFDSTAVSDVLTAIAATGVSGRTIIDLSTNHHRRVLEFHQLCTRSGNVYLEAPVLGSVGPAAKGELTVLVSGEEAEFERAKNLLERIGKTIHFLGAPGNATIMKLVNNHLLGTFMAAIAEAVALGERAGIPREKVVAILSTGAGNSGVFNAKKDKLLNEDFSPQFSAALIYKDLGYLLELASDLKYDVKLAQTTRRLYELTMQDSPHAQDFSVVFKHLK